MDDELALLHKKIDLLTSLVEMQNQRLEELEVNGNGSQAVITKLDYLSQQFEVLCQHQDEMDELKQRKIREVQEKIQEQQQQQALKQQYEIQKRQALHQILDPAARSRLSNLRTAKPEFVEQLEVQIIQLVSAGRIKPPVSDEQLRVLLGKLQEHKREINIRRR